MSEDQPIVTDPYIDVKASKIRLLASIVGRLNETSGTSSKLVVVTNFGIAEGVLDNSDPIDLETATEFRAMDVFASMSTDFHRSLSKDGTQIEQIKQAVDTLYLNDVSVRPFASPNTTFNFDKIALFSDQIVGVTVKGSE